MHKVGISMEHDYPKTVSGTHSFYTCIHSAKQVPPTKSCLHITSGRALLQVLSQHVKGGRPVLEGIAHATPKRWEKLQKPRRRVGYIDLDSRRLRAVRKRRTPTDGQAVCVPERACSTRAKVEDMGAALPRRPPRQGRHALIQTGKPESTPAGQCTTRHTRGGRQPLAVCAQHRVLTSAPPQSGSPSLCCRARCWSARKGRPRPPQPLLGLPASAALEQPAPSRPHAILESKT
jgi:hypothetical protein